MNMFGFYASDYYRGKIEETLLKSLDRKFHMPKYRKSVVRVFTDLLHSIQETVIQYATHFVFYQRAALYLNADKRDNTGQYGKVFGVVFRGTVSAKIAFKIAQYF